MGHTSYEYSVGLHRARRGLVFGVCRGFAEHFDFSVFWTRFIVLMAFLLTDFWIMGAAYIIAALLMKRAPLPQSATHESGSCHSRAHAPSMGAGRLRGTFEGLDRRMQRLESIVTAPDYSWDERLNDS